MARRHEKYLKQKIKDNDNLNTRNSERFIDGAQRYRFRQNI